MADNRLLYVVIEEFNSKKAYMGLDEVKTETKAEPKETTNRFKR